MICYRNCSRFPSIHGHVRGGKREDFLSHFQSAITYRSTIPKQRQVERGNLPSQSSIVALFGFGIRVDSSELPLPSAIARIQSGSGQSVASPFETAPPSADVPPQQQHCPVDPLSSADGTWGLVLPSIHLGLGVLQQPPFVAHHSPCFKLRDSLQALARVPHCCSPGSS